MFFCCSVAISSSTCFKAAILKGLGAEGEIKLKKIFKEIVALFSVFVDNPVFSFQIMAVPPTYADLGKSARDVFTKGYGKHR